MVEIFDGDGGSCRSSLASEALVKVTKLDAARNQLDTAIRLFLAEADPVSTHTLAAAAYEILDGVAKQRQRRGAGGAPMSEVLDQIIKPEARSEFLKLMRAPQNFFKHAASDPEATLEFFAATQGHFWILLGVESYKALTKSLTMPMQVFLVWFMLVNPDLVTVHDPSLAAVLASFEKLFGRSEALSKGQWFELLNLMEPFQKAPRDP